MPDSVDLNFRMKIDAARKETRRDTEEGINPKIKTDVSAKNVSTNPVYLRQRRQDSLDTKTASKGDKNKEDDNFVLSIYEIRDQFKKLLSNFPEAKYEVEVLGRTASYNNILLYKISQLKGDDVNFRADDKYLEDKPEKKIIFIVHALSPMGISKLYSLIVESYLKQLLSFYLAHLDKFNIFLIPMANPDGYVQNKYVKFWNKNISPQAACSGVTLDRNFDVAWNTSQQIMSCSQLYPGSSPFSEPETRAVRDVFHRYSHKIIAYFHVHAGSYERQTFKGEAVLYPKGYTEAQSDDDKYIDIKAEIDEAITTANFKSRTVTVDTLYNWYGKVSGASVDYATSIYGIPYAMELVMQIHHDPFTLNNKRSRLTVPAKIEVEYHALREIWGRVIKVIFMNIWKKSTMNDALV